MIKWLLSSAWITVTSNALFTSWEFLKIIALNNGPEWQLVCSWSFVRSIISCTFLYWSFLIHSSAAEIIQIVFQLYTNIFIWFNVETITITLIFFTIDDTTLGITELGIYISFLPAWICESAGASITGLLFLARCACSNWRFLVLSFSKIQIRLRTPEKHENVEII